MEKQEAIARFIEKRPEAIGIYGYGSGIFNQGYSSDVKPLIDMIFVVDDLVKWHQENMQKNKKDYSFLGKIHFSRAEAAKIKGKNKITYVSSIKEGPYSFKYGVIEIHDFVESLETWNTFFIAGRFQKPVLKIVTDEVLNDAIAYNRKCAFMLACLFSEAVTSIRHLYMNLCSLSYRGDVRMTFAENPHKVENIVKGSYSSLTELYPACEDFVSCLLDTVVEIDFVSLLQKIKELPAALVTYLEQENIDLSNVEVLRDKINFYLSEKNKVESRAQILEGVRTNGIVRSTPYVLEKVKKRFC